MQPRQHDRRSGRRRAVLPARARPFRNAGARPAHRRLHRRGHRRYSRARMARPVPRRHGRMAIMTNAAEACATANGEELFACAAPQHFAVDQYRADFPALAQQIHGRPLVYLDTGASALKPRMVIESMSRFMETDYANIHRGVHTLSQRATDKYEAVRATVRRFINAEYDDEIIFTRGATESINLVAQTWGRTCLKTGDEIVITALEHHANIVPWQMLRDQTGISLRIVPVTPEGDVRLEDVKAALSPRTKLVAVAHISNVLGTVLPVREIAALAHAAGAKILIDGCQAVSHMPVDVRDIDADFYVFSGHKLYGPNAIGILYGKRDILAQMPPYQGGGDMIESVTFEKTTYKEPPHRFEAGTPPITEVIGLGAAIEYISTIGMARIARHETDILAYATEKLSRINSLKIIGTSPHKAGIVSFTMEHAHPHDIGTILDRQGVAVRAGHHCAQPLMEFMGIGATARASFGLYTSRADIDALAAAVAKVQEIFA
ncbi:MAG: cysteine desulfurase [Alphaproteobacteria bacterium]|nr:cysteine desulfurase [Alphaproteobacteria bacterium]